MAVDISVVFVVVRHHNGGQGCMIRETLLTSRMKLFNLLTQLPQYLQSLANIPYMYNLFIACIKFVSMARLSLYSDLI